MKKGTFEDIFSIDTYEYLFEIEEKAFSEHSVSGGKVIKIDYVKKDDFWMIETINSINDFNGFLKISIL